MVDDRLVRMLIEGETLEASASLAGLSENDYRALAARMLEETPDRADLLDLVSDLVYPPPFPAGLSERERLLRAEGMRLLAAEVAAAVAGEDWQDIIPFMRELSADLSYRVREAAVRLIARVASGTFERSQSFWLECLLEGEASLGSCVLRGLAVCQAPPLKVLDLFSAVRADIRKDIRHTLSPKALPELGRREPKTVFTVLQRWAGEPGEIIRWNVAQALATPLGGVYIEDAMEILEKLAADERPIVWRAAANAVVHIAQRRPSFVLPILARWRTDPERSRAADLALKSLVKQR